MSTSMGNPSVLGDDDEFPLPVVVFVVVVVVVAVVVEVYDLILPCQATKQDWGVR